MRSVLPLLSLAALAACDPEPTAPPVHDVMPGYDAFGACDDVDPLKRPYFGDTHVHTTLSLDANLQGTRLTPEDAYRFAQGEAVGIQPYDADGQALRTVQLDRPLDFVALSDHAEFLGQIRYIHRNGADTAGHGSAFTGPDRRPAPSGSSRLLSIPPAAFLRRSVQPPARSVAAAPPMTARCSCAAS